MVGIKEEKLVAGEKVSVPLIDFKDLADPAEHASVIAQVARACETIGFFEMINSGIPREILGEAFDTSRDFYNLPDGEKRELAPDLKEKTPMVPVFQLGYKGHPILRGVLNRMEELVFRNYHMREGE
jgi:isopenicillin N synthase-like dioxygenase